MYVILKSHSRQECEWRRACAHSCPCHRDTRHQWLPFRKRCDQQVERCGEARKVANSKALSMQINNLLFACREVERIPWRPTVERVTAGALVCRSSYPCQLVTLCLVSSWPLRAIYISNWRLLVRLVLSQCVTIICHLDSSIINIQLNNSLSEQRTIRKAVCLASVVKIGK